MSRPKLLLVSDYAWRTGGAEEFVAQFLMFAQSDYECRLATWSPNVKVPPDFTGLAVVQCGDFRTLWTELESAAVIVVCTSFNVRLLARATLDFLGTSTAKVVTVVQTSGHSDPTSGARELQERWLVALARVSSRVVAVSSDVAAALEELQEFPRERLLVIENGARLHASPAKRRSERLSVSYIGRPHPQKGFHLFERLVSDVGHQGLRFAANTVSVPPPSMLPGVEYSYLLSDEQLIAFYRDADLILAPYLRADGLPMAVLDALSCGVPVLGFDTPGLGALLRRHAQPVVPPEYEALRQALESWRLGRLNPVPPPPGAIPLWQEQVAEYLGVIDEIVGAR